VIAKLTGGPVIELTSGRLATIREKTRLIE
jgi:hypothetical protein